MKKKYRLYTYDVWGNSKDGYDVNNVFKTDTILEFEPAIDDKQLIKLLKKEGLIKKYIRFNSIEIGGDDLTITFDYKGKPEFELQQIEED